MVDNRYNTALVIACVLSILATVYLSVAVGTQHWYAYSSPTVRGEANVSELRSLYDEFAMDAELDEKTCSDALFRLNGTVGLWWRCVLVPDTPHWYKDADLWRFQFLLPLVSLGLEVLSGLIGFFACLCQSLAPTLAIGVLHLLTGLCSLATVCCYLAGMDLLHRVSVLPDKVDGSLGWSLYLALMSSPLHMMAAALLVWAARSHSRTYYRMSAYRVA
ncbi:claudin domain-containing protein 1-like isoform X2 [Entelurus aequoreus]|uniref:claudin domain-containing protein 1-like isoform X2 n=1 Tax=Entelurus aequoreus TaxID=161455 RepID=UPI002B1D294C|nr:claudin domain-containing protein 1-like isoform X2 [Entelurus aequoreus]